MSNALKTSRRWLTLLPLLLAAMLAMGAGIAEAQETARIAIPASLSVSAASDFIAVTGVVNGMRSFSGSCMRHVGFTDDHDVRKMVVIDTAQTPAATIVGFGVTLFPLKPGTRLTNLSFVGSCSDGGVNFNIYDGTIASPQNLDVALVITPAGVTLTADREGVVGAGTDELGIADAVCVKKGEKSIQTELLSDVDLSAGDRLTEFTEVDFNPDTGETMYACWLEY